MDTPSRLFYSRQEYIGFDRFLLKSAVYNLAGCVESALILEFNPKFPASKSEIHPD